MSRNVAELAEAAEAAFWTMVADRIPADSGDLDPALAVKFSIMCREVVAAWIETNANSHDCCVSCGKIVEVREDGTIGDETEIPAVELDGFMCGPCREQI